MVKTRFVAHLFWIITMLLAFSAVFIQNNVYLLIGIVVCVLLSICFYTIHWYKTKKENV
ncbi:hypothetical protein JCM19046_3770 [Bacillus sp. JCM 19046]|nr:hypothetical protein JCM19046_3770 [Bacillus sp. JCM 19046]